MSETTSDSAKAAFVATVGETITKPGYKTTEFWATAAVTIIGLLMSSGVIQTGGTWDRAIGLAAAALASMGYSASRAKVKS